MSVTGTVYPHQIGQPSTGGSKPACGTPSVNQSNPKNNVVDGEDACAEGRNNTVHGDKATVLSGENNEDDGENSVIAGEQNTIGEHSDCAIIGGQQNTIGPTGGSENAIIGGDNNTVDNSTACAVVASEFSALRSSVNVACVGSDECADDTIDGQSNGLVTGQGGVIWAAMPSLVLGQGGSPLTGPDGHLRPTGQYQVTGQGTFMSEDATPVAALDLAILAFGSLLRLHGTVLARQTDADVGSIWSFDMGVSSVTGTGARFLPASPTVTLIDQDPGAAAWAVAITLGPLLGDFNALTFTVTGDPAHEVLWQVRITIDEEYTGN